jgi:multidrug efflux system outer membrane protein
MGIIKRKLLWPVLGLALILPAGCSGSTVKLDSDSHARILQQDRQSLREDGPSQQTVSLSLEQAIEIGTTKNLDVRVAALEELSQQNNVTLAQLRALPGVEISGGYTDRSNDGASSSESVLTGQQSLEPSKSTEQHRRVATLEINWNLLDAALALADAAKAGDEAGVAKERYAKVIQNVERDVYTAYWRASAYQESRDKTAKLLMDTRDQMEKLDHAVSKKLMSSDEASQKMALLAERERNLRDLNDRLQLAEVELKSLLTIPMGTKLILTTKRDNIAFEVERLISSDVSGQEWQALKTRPEMREEILKKNMTIRDARREIYQTFPGLNLLFSNEYDSNKYLVDPNWSNFSAKIVQTITGVITLPNRYNAAKNKEVVADARRQALSSAIVAQVHMGRMRLASMNETNIQSRLAQKAASRKSHAIAGKKMQGMASGQDELLAQIELQIETMRANIVYADLQDAYAAMKNTLGERVVATPQKLAMAGT